MSEFDGAACLEDPLGMLLPDLTADAQAEAAQSHGAYMVIRGGAAQVRRWDVDLAFARSLCIGCPVLATCRDHARAVPVSGVVAGLTESERAEAGWGPIDDVSERSRWALGETHWQELLGDAAEQWPHRRSEGTPPGVLAAVAELHDRGLSDPQVAAKLAPFLDEEMTGAAVCHIRGLLTGRRSLPRSAVAS